MDGMFLALYWIALFAIVNELREDNRFFGPLTDEIRDWPVPVDDLWPTPKAS